MDPPTKLNALPIVEDDTVVLLDHAEKRIKIGTVLTGEISHIPTSPIFEDGHISVRWHSNFEKQRVRPTEVRVLENRCELGQSVCSLKDKDKYGVCIKTKAKATCVVLDEAAAEKRYLLNVDVDRLQSFADIHSDLCFYKNAIFEVSEIVYQIKLNYQNKRTVEIRSTKHNFMKRFVVLDDQYNANYPKDKPLDLNYSRRAPYSFNEIIGKLTGCKLSELGKFKGCPELKQLISLVYSDETSGENAGEIAGEIVSENGKVGDDSVNNKDTDGKEHSRTELTFVFNRELARMEQKAKKEKLIKFTVCDVKISEVTLNSIKDFTSSEQEFKTEKLTGDQVDKVKFFKINERPIDLGSRWKLQLNERDELVDFERCESHLNENIKAKVANLPRLPEDLDLSDYHFEVNRGYERQPEAANRTEAVNQTEATNRSEPADAPSAIDSPPTDNSWDTLTDAIDETLDEVFSEMKLDTKPLSREELRNHNLMMLSRLNRRSRNSTGRSGSLGARPSPRPTNERLMNGSFRKIKLGSSCDDSQEINEVDLSGLTKKLDQTAESPQPEEKTVLVDVLCLNKFVDVQWQDGTIETDVPLSAVTEEIDSLQSKFYPGDFVEWVTGELKDGLEPPTYGVIQRIKQAANLAEVRWFHESVAKQSDDVNNNQSKPWTTYESVFNLRSSCIHFHLGDIVVDQRLITNFSEIILEDMPKLIGVIKCIQVDGTAQCEWADGSESTKKLVELVSFFDVEFSDYSEDNDSYSTINDSQLSSASAQDEESMEFDDSAEMRYKFTDLHRFNKYQFEYIRDDLCSPANETELKEKWLQKLDTVVKLVQEFKQLQLELLDKQVGYNETNYAQDKRIIELTFELLRCYHEKIRNDIASFGLASKGKIYSDELVANMNDWLDVIQSKFECLYRLLERNAELKSLVNLAAKKLNVADQPDASVEEEKNQKQYSRDYRRKMIVLLNKFNREVVRRIQIEKEDAERSICEFEDSLNTSNLVIDEQNTSARSEQNAELDSQSGGFKRVHCLSLEEAGIKHAFKSSSSYKKASATKVNLNVLLKEIALLRSSLPRSGIYFRTFEERLDLLSLMIEGPTHTVYENHLFLFDLQITDRLQDPPECFYLSFGKKQLNPNLYTDGNVCLSLLNTFFGKSEVEKWQPGKSSLLQLALSLQALVLNSNPFYNEADFDVYCNTEEGLKKSKSYNEFVIVSLIDYSIDLYQRRAELAFKDEIERHYQANAFAIYKRYFDFISISMNWATKLRQAGKLDDREQNEQFKQMLASRYPQFTVPPFHLLPASEGFCLSLSRNLKSFSSFFQQHLPSAEIESMQKQLDELISLIEV